jgi:invasion protein IalB
MLGAASRRRLGRDSMDCPHFAEIGVHAGWRRLVARSGVFLAATNQELFMGDALFPSRRLWALSLAACCLLAVVCLLGAATSPAAAQGAVKGKFGDWEMRCEIPPGASREQCALLQSIATEDKPNVNLVVIVLKTADGKSRLLRVITQLGVLLPAGLGLKIDQTDVGRAGFVRCLASGCVAEVVMEDKLIEQLSSGATATFIVFNTPEEGVGIPMALGGFKDGFAKLP